VVVAVKVAAAAAAAPRAGGEDEDATLAELAAGGAADAPAAGPAEPEKVKQKHLDKARAKAEAAEREAAAREAAEEEAALGEDPGERARKIRELQLKAEMDLAAAQFGGGAPAAGGAAGGALPTDPVLLLAAVPLADKDGFTKFGAAAARRVAEAAGAKATLAMCFYNEALSVAAERLSAADLSTLSGLLETKARVKRDAEKKATKKPSKAKQLGKLAVGGDYDDYGDDYEHPPAKAGAGGAGAGAGAGAAGAEGGAVPASGNVGNVAASLAAAGISGGGTGSGFVRTKYDAESDFM